MINATNLTSGRLLARNTIFNLAGDAVPFLVAIVAIPMLIRGLGVDRYGVLTLAMLSIGYFGVFNLGLGRAATKFIAEAAVSGDRAQVSSLFWTSLVLMFGFGVFGAILAAALSPWLVSHVLKIAPALQSESLGGFYLLAFSLPFVISGGVLNGALAAFQRFDLINAISVPTNVLCYLAPLPILCFSRNLSWVVATIVLVRIASWLANFGLCFQVFPELKAEIKVRRDLIRPMLAFGGWITISSIVLPIMDYADRFMIGGVLTVGAVAYYTVSFQVTNKLRVIPAALSGVMFPAFSGSLSANPERAAILFERSLRYIFLVMFPLVLVVVTLSSEGLTFWLGATFADRSSSVMRWLAAGMFINGLAWTPYFFLQAAHRPDLTAKLSSVELPLFLVLLWCLLREYGVEGAAAAFAIRSVVSAIVLFAMTCRLLPSLVSGVMRIAKAMMVSLTALAIGVLPMTLSAKGSYLVAALAFHAIFCWTMLFDPSEKDLFRRYLRTAIIAVTGVFE